MAHVLAKELREAVLQAAMSGNLTSRNIEDTKVSDTITKIHQDRDKRILNKEIKTDKRLNDKLIEEPRFDIPNSWKWVRLGTVLYKLTDGTHKTPKYTENGVKFVSVKDMSSGFLDLSNTKYISDTEHSELFSRCNPEKGDILLSKVGTTGVPAIVNTDESFSLFVSVALLKFNELLINRNYLYRVLQSPDVQQQAAENTKGIGNKNWVLDKIANTKIPLPPIEEQARIVAKVDEIMAKIDEYEKSEKKLEKLEKEFPEDMKASLLQAAMQGKLTEQHPEEDGYAIDLLNQIQEEKKHLVKEGKIKKQPKTKPITEDEIPFDIPDNWEWARLVNIAKVEMGSSPKGEFIHKGGKGKEFHQGKIYFGKTNLLYSNLKTDKITRCAHSGDILLCVRAPIGEINFTDRDICIGRGLSAISGYSNVSQKYLFYCLKAFKQDLILKGTGSTFKAITANVVKDQLIPLPPLAEQHRIVKKLDELLPLCEILKED